MTELGETEEYLGSKSVGSSTMPQKRIQEDLEIYLSTQELFQDYQRLFWMT